MKDRNTINGPHRTVELLSRISLVLAIFLAISIGGSVAYDKTVFPGQWVNLSGPSAPEGVTYNYEWHIKQGELEVSVKNADSDNVAKDSRDLKFWAPWYSSDTVLNASLLVSAQKAGGSPLAGCSQTTTASVLIQAPTDSDLTGDTGDLCTDATSTYTYSKPAPGLTYQWYLGPINANPATQLITGYYTAGITPSSITTTTSSITIDWDSLAPALTDTESNPVPPQSGTFTVTLQITQGGTLQRTISKTVNLVPKPMPSISIAE